MFILWLTQTHPRHAGIETQWVYTSAQFLIFKCSFLVITKDQIKIRAVLLRTVGVSVGLTLDFITLYIVTVDDIWTEVVYSQRCWIKAFSKILLAKSDIITQCPSHIMFLLLFFLFIGETAVFLDIF